MMPYPFPPRSKIRPTSCPGRSKIVSAEGTLGSRSAFLAHFFLRMPLQKKLGPLPEGPSSQILEKMCEMSISGVSPGGPTFFTVGEVDKVSIYIVKKNFSKITSLKRIHVDGPYLRHRATSHMLFS
jgi:hypothetical protein